jgi:LacI family transcriptional regulator
MTRLLERGDSPTAVFCYNDRVAMSAYAAIHERGLRIPDDIAVIGFDNHEVIAAHLRPPLSNMALPHHSMGLRGAEYLLKLEDAPETTEPISERLRCELVARAAV